MNKMLVYKTFNEALEKVIRADNLSTLLGNRVFHEVQQLQDDAFVIARVNMDTHKIIEVLQE